MAVYFSTYIKKYIDVGIIALGAQGCRVINI